jgi:prolipoprotein diacylglyceryl transferase
VNDALVFNFDPILIRLGPFGAHFAVAAVAVIGALSMLAGWRKERGPKSVLARNLALLLAGALVIGLLLGEREVGPLQIRYYGIIFAAMLYIGFLLWRWQMLRGGHPSDVADRYLIWGVIAVLAGSRLGHVFFYEPEKYLADPITILHVWEGGLASHGATVGLVLAMLLFSWKYHLRFVEVLDRFSMPSAVGAAAVRLGNFLNSEIVGRVSDVPWAMRFPRHDCHAAGLCHVFESDNPEGHRQWAALLEQTPARHPSQLYEFFLGLFVLLVLYLADRRFGREKRPLGLLAGLFLTVYFTGRFAAEFVKEFQTLDPNTSALTMGQYLSILPVLVGVAMVVWALKRGRPTDEGRPAEAAAAAEPAPARPASARQKRRKK